MESVKLPSHIHYEITSYCNLKCPLCLRTKLDNVGKMNPQHLSYNAIKKTLHDDLNYALFCGNLGDPLMHPSCDKIFKLFSEDTFIQINTNGSIREPSWYRNMAKRKNLLMEFSIDGISDTNGLYRIDAKWDDIMRNTEAFIESGGIARWSFIFFKHNEHQFEEVKEMAKKRGFKQFKTKISQRTSTVDLKENLIHPNHLQPEIKDIECFAYDNDAIFINATGEVDLCTWSQPLKFPRNIYDEDFKSIVNKFRNADTDLQKIWMCRSNKNCNAQCGTVAGGTIKEVFLEF